MPKILAAIIILIICLSSVAKSQNTYDNIPTKINFQYNLFGKKNINDTVDVVKSKGTTQSRNIGGIFLSPSIGLTYPLGTFAGNSGNGFVYGGKLEFAFSKLYPFIPGFVYEGQSYKGDAGYMNNNLLTTFSTDIYYLGGSLDIILNKFLKSDFTTPIISLEVKYANMTRDVAPDVTLPDIEYTQSLLTYAGSLSFTLYVFDLCTKYTYAGEYTNLNFQLRFHFPVVKF